MRLFVLYTMDTFDWTIMIHNGNTFVESSVFVTKNKIHAFTIAAGYLSIFSDMRIDPASELLWRQLGLKAAKEIAAMQQ